MPPRGRPLSARKVALKYGFRSGLEEQIGDTLRAGGTPFLYEAVVIPFVQPPKERTYTADFILPNGIVIESKGRFVTADRQKHLWVKAQHPNLDIRFVFSNSRSRISKQSQTTYAKWCTSKGFQFADREIPESWLSERANAASRKAIEALLTPDKIATLPWK